MSRWTYSFHRRKHEWVFFLSLDGKLEEIISGSRTTEIQYADVRISPVQPELILSIQQLHREHGEIVNTIAAINTQTKISKVTTENANLYFHPRFSPDGENIHWMQWNHPDMPRKSQVCFAVDCCSMSRIVHLMVHFDLVLFLHEVPNIQENPIVEEALLRQDEYVLSVGLEST